MGKFCSNQPLTEIPRTSYCANHTAQMCPPPHAHKALLLWIASSYLWLSWRHRTLEERTCPTRSPETGTHSRQKDKMPNTSTLLTQLSASEFYLHNAIFPKCPWMKNASEPWPFQVVSATHDPSLTLEISRCCPYLFVLLNTWLFQGNKEVKHIGEQTKVRS